MQRTVAPESRCPRHTKPRPRPPRAAPARRQMRSAPNACVQAPAGAGPRFRQARYRTDGKTQLLNPVRPPLRLIPTLTQAPRSFRMSQSSFGEALSRLWPQSERYRRCPRQGHRWRQPNISPGPHREPGDPAPFLKTPPRRIEMISRRILAAAAALLYLLAAPSHAVAQVQQVFSTLATATAATIPASIDTVTTLGRNAAGDYGGASYIRIGASTAAAWRFQSADGQWWAINNRIVTPEMFGCFSSTDCTSAFLSLSSWLQTASSGGITNGGIIVNFKPGADYKIWPSGTTPNGGGALQLYSVNGVTFNYNGARISTDNDWTTHDGIVVRVINGSNLIFNDPSYACTSCSGSIDFSKYGIQFYIAEASAPWSNNIQINNATQFWGSAFLEVSGDVNSATPGATQDQAHNISVINADLQHVFYGLNFQAAGDNFFARGVKCTDCARIYFPWNVSNHDVELIKNGGGSGFVSVMLKAYALPGGSDIKRSLSNIRVKYRDSGETAATAVVVGLDMQQTVAQPNVSGAAGNGSGLLRLTVDTTANMATGQTWFVNSVGGITNVNGASYVVTVIDGTHVDLQGSGGFGGSYTSGGYMRVPAALRDISIQVENTLAANQPP